MISPIDDLVTVAFKVCTALQDVGVEAVLCGGSAATFYAPDAYQSSDLDFVLSWRSARADEAKAEEVIRSLGFYQKGRTLVSDSSAFSLDFPKGPLAVGEAAIEHWQTVTRGELVLHVIHAEDCIKDRLCAFFYWKDRSGVQQAVYVAKSVHVDLEEIASWATTEGQEQKFDEVLSRLTGD